MNYEKKKRSCRVCQEFTEGNEKNAQQNVTIYINYTYNEIH